MSRDKQFVVLIGSATLLCFASIAMMATAAFIICTDTPTTTRDCIAISDYYPEPLGTDEFIRYTLSCNESSCERTLDRQCWARLVRNYNSQYECATWSRDYRSAIVTPITVTSMLVLIVFCSFYYHLIPKGIVSLAVVVTIQILVLIVYNNVGNVPNQDYSTDSGLIPCISTADEQCVVSVGPTEVDRLISMRYIVIDMMDWKFPVLLTLGTILCVAYIFIGVYAIALYEQPEGIMPEEKKGLTE